MIKGHHQQLMIHPTMWPKTFAVPKDGEMTLHIPTYYPRTHI
jgi:hypothetical protein